MVNSEDVKIPQAMGHAIAPPGQPWIEKGCFPQRPLPGMDPTDPTAYPDGQGGTNISGLGVNEYRLMLALQTLLAQHEYQGQWERGGIRHPLLFATMPEILEAYGLTPTPSGQYDPKRRADVAGALKALAVQRFTAFVRFPGMTGVTLYSESLINMRLYYGPKGEVDAVGKQMAAGQFGEVMDAPPDDIFGEDGRAKATGVFIELKDLFWFGINAGPNSYYLCPSGLDEEIQAWRRDVLGRKRGRYSPAIWRFLHMLMQHSVKHESPIGWDALISKIGLGGYIRERKRKDAEAIIREALQCAKDLGFLVDYEAQGSGPIKMQLNPARCSRLARGDKKTAP
jgi:hypothetical protein